MDFELRRVAPADGVNVEGVHPWQDMLAIAVVPQLHLDQNTLRRLHQSRLANLLAPGIDDLGDRLRLPTPVRWQADFGFEPKPALPPT